MKLLSFILKVIVYSMIIIGIFLLCLWAGVTCGRNYPLAYSSLMFNFGGTAWIYPLLIFFFFVFIMFLHIIIAYYTNKIWKIAIFIWGPICLAFAANALTIKGKMRDVKYRENGFLSCGGDLYDSKGNCIYSDRHDYTRFEFNDKYIIVRGEDYIHPDSTFVDILDYTGEKIPRCEYSTLKSVEDNYRGKEAQLVICPMCNGTGIFDFMPGDAMAPKQICGACNGNRVCDVNTAQQVMQAKAQIDAMMGGTVIEDGYSSGGSGRDAYQIEHELNKAYELLERMQQNYENCSSGVIRAHYPSMIVEQKERIRQLEAELQNAQ